MRLSDLVDTWQRVAQASGKKEKVARLAECLRRAGPAWVAAATAMLSGETRQGRIGIGPSLVRDALATPPAETSTLTVAELEAALERLGAATGAGSKAARAALLSQVMGRATPDEQRFLARLLLGELRQGAVEGLMADAVAQAAGLPGQSVRRAAMLAGELPAVAEAALTDGRAGLARFHLRLFRPVQPMLAQTADGAADAVERLGRAGLEYKLDGARIQVHRAGADVRVFTRGLNDVTQAVPEVVELARALPGHEAILDGEAIALDPDGRPRPFQVTMRRFGRKLDVAALRGDLPLSAFFFDCLRLDGVDLLDEPAAERVRALVETLPSGLRVPRLVTASPDEAEAFLEAAVAAGHEGVMAKALEAAYEAGSRGRSWLKVKPAHTLDLVVLAAEWGHGRRRGWLSNLHLGARDPVGGGFVMLGKTFKGLTDAMLAWQTEHLLGLEAARDAYTVYVRPELVVEVAFDGLQQSPQYPAGLALRFARVKRFRSDKRADQADTVEAVRRLAATGRAAPPPGRRG